MTNSRETIDTGSTASAYGIQVNDRILRDEGIANAGIIPGAMVINDAAVDNQIGPAGAAAQASSVIGHALGNLKPGKAYTDAFVSTDVVPYNKDTNSAWMGLIKASSSALKYGSPLKTGSSGTYELWVSGTDAEDLVVAFFDEKAALTPGGTAVYHRIRRGAA